MSKLKIQTLADELESNLDQQEELKDKLKPLEDREEEIRAEILTGLQEKGFKHIRTSSGLGFGIIQGRKTFSIIKGKEEEAYNWAYYNYPAILIISAARLAVVVKPMLEMPPFLEAKTGQPHLAITNSETDAETN